MKNKLDNF